MFFTQDAYRYRLDWGRRGAREAADRGDVLVIVDTLSFSTAVATAIQRGGLIYPCAHAEDAVAFAQRVGAQVAVHRKKYPAGGRYSLSPLTFLAIEPGERVVLPSLNGATCSRYARHVPYLFVGTLINAEAVAAAVEHILRKHPQLAVTVIACGERWQTPSEDGELRFAVEDYLGAGAILSYVQGEKSPEARICEGAFLSARDHLAELLWECGSGRELRTKGYSDDVRHAAQLNVYDRVPMMRGECLEAYDS